MSEEMSFFMYLLEFYAAYKNKKTADVLKEWDARGITQKIYDNYWGITPSVLRMPLWILTA